MDESTPTIQKRRDQVSVGDVIRSSHGYRLLITKVRDDAPVRTDERSVELGGRLHADPDAPFRNEIYPVTATVAVERPGRFFHVTVARPGLTVAYDCLAAANAVEAGGRARVWAARQYDPEPLPYTEARALGLEPGVDPAPWTVERVEQVA